MRRIAIIDHDTHSLYVEDVSDETMEMYNDDEQLYIKDNYKLENYSWDWIVDSEYYPEESKDPIEIHFDELL